MQIFIDICFLITFVFLIVQTPNLEIYRAIAVMKRSTCVSRTKCYLSSYGQVRIVRGGGELHGAVVHRCCSFF